MTQDEAALAGQLRELTVAELAELDGIEEGDEVRLDGFEFGGREYRPATAEWYDEENDILHEAEEELPAEPGRVFGQVSSIDEDSLVIEMDGIAQIRIWDYGQAKPVKLQDDLEGEVLKLKAWYLVTYSISAFGNDYGQRSKVCWLLDPEDEDEICSYLYENDDELVNTQVDYYIKVDSVILDPPTAMGEPGQ